MLRKPGRCARSPAIPFLLFEPQKVAAEIGGRSTETARVVESVHDRLYVSIAQEMARAFSGSGATHAKVLQVANAFLHGPALSPLRVALGP